MAGWLAGWSAGWLAGQLGSWWAGGLVGWSAGRLVGWSVGWPGWSVSWSVGWSVGRRVGWSAAQAQRTAGAVGSIAGAGITEVQKSVRERQCSERHIVDTHADFKLV